MSATLLEFPTSRAAVTPEPADSRERAAALDPERSFLVEAPAGSGKTGLLVQRLLTLLCRVDRPESVLALTFTNKATAEMRERVLKALALADQDPSTLSEFDRTTHGLATATLVHDRALGWNLQANSYRLNIRTIDSLCGEISRSLPLSSGAIGQMTPVEDALPLYHRAARAVTLRLGGENAILNDALRTVLLRRDADLHNCESLLAEMLGTREQWRRLIPLTPEELTDEFLDHEVKPRLDRALEAIVCAALRNLEAAFPAPELHTLTQLALRLSTAPASEEHPHPLSGCASLKGVPGSAAVDVNHWVMLSHLLLTQDGWRKPRGLNTRNLKVELGKEKKPLAELLESLSKNDELYRHLCNLRNLPPAVMPAEDWHMTKALFHLLHFALLELRAIFRESNTCDFTERSLAAHAALNAASGEGPSRLLDQLGLQHLLVDEMQDTSSAQYKLLESLTRGWDGRTRTVFLVGDPKQSIYLFRQARVERFLESLTSGRLGAVPLTTLRLTTNFRSAAPLVREFNGIFGPVFQAAGDGEIQYTAATAARTSENGELHWCVAPLWGEHASEERRRSRRKLLCEQAQHIVHTVQRLQDETGTQKPLTFAVLVRNREHASHITRQFREAGIAFRGVELEALNERPEVLDSLALTRALLHPADRVAWLAVLRAPWCGATLADLYHLSGGDEGDRNTTAPRSLFRERATGLCTEAQARVLRTLDVLDVAVAAVGRMPLAEIVERAGRALGVDHFRSPAERTNVQRFLELLEQAEAELRPLEAVDLQTRLSRLYAEPDTTPGAVEIMTIHKAKGLEWDVVFVPELQRASGRNGQRLLDWLEVSTRTPEARSEVPDSAGVLLAPVPPRGTKAAELPCYVQAARRRQSEAELARLFYVAVTRARRQLYLYAAPALKQETGEVSHPSGTLLHTAWPAAEPIVQAKVNEQQDQPSLIAAMRASANEDEDDLRSLADLRRVSDSFDPAAMQEESVLPWLRASATEPPPPTAVPELEAVLRPEGSLSSRALGTAVHLYLDRLASEIAAVPNRPPLAWVDTVESWHGRIQATLRSLGTGGAAAERDTEHVLLALRNTLQSPEGFWLLQAHPRAVSEQTLLVESSNGHTSRTMRLDRSFLAGSRPGSTIADGGQATLWIVEYKTAVAGDTPMDEFLAEQRARYAPQLRNYANMLAAQGSSPSHIMLALFYPLQPAFDAWALEKTGEHSERAR